MNRQILESIDKMKQIPKRDFTKDFLEQHIRIAGFKIDYLEKDFKDLFLIIEFLEKDKTEQNYERFLVKIVYLLDENILKNLLLISF